MAFFYYCPNCGLSQEIRWEDMPRNKVGNIRDGFGTPIYHYECRACGNLDAGAMRINEDAPNWEEYCKSVISFYQGVRGFAKKKEDGD